MRNTYSSVNDFSLVFSLIRGIRHIKYCWNGIGFELPFPIRTVSSKCRLSVVNKKSVILLSWFILVISAPPLGHSEGADPLPPKQCLRVGNPSFIIDPKKVRELVVSALGVFQRNLTQALRKEDSYMCRIRASPMTHGQV